MTEQYENWKREYTKSSINGRMLKMQDELTSYCYDRLQSKIWKFSDTEMCHQCTYQVKIRFQRKHKRTVVY